MGITNAPALMAGRSCIGTVMKIYFPICIQSNNALSTIISHHKRIKWAHVFMAGRSRICTVMKICFSMCIQTNNVLSAIIAACYKAFYRIANILICRLPLALDIHCI